MTPPSPTSRIRSLDGLRGIAIALVIAGHGGEAAGWGEHPWWLAPAFNASFGVRLFFVLSGFLITRLLIRESEKFGRISLQAFYARRCLRIFPAFYSYLAFIGILAAAGIIEVSWQQMAAAATYSWNYLPRWYSGGPAEGAWFLGHLWTLSLEEQFYLLWPPVVVFLGWRHARWMAVFIPLLLPLIRVTSYFGFPSHRGQLGMMFHTAIDSILIGCAFALWEQPIRDWLSRRSALLPFALVFPFLISPCIGALFRPYYVTVGFGMDAVCAGALILYSMAPGRLATALSWSPLVATGTLSYSLYLWQQPFLTTFNQTATGQFPWNLLAIVLFALASFHLIESPVMRLKGRFVRV